MDSGLTASDVLAMTRNTGGMDAATAALIARNDDDHDDMWNNP